MLRAVFVFVILGAYVACNENAGQDEDWRKKGFYRPRRTNPTQNNNQNSFQGDSQSLNRNSRASYGLDLENRTASSLTRNRESRNTFQPYPQYNAQSQSAFRTSSFYQNSQANKQREQNTFEKSLYQNLQPPKSTPSTLFAHNYNSQKTIGPESAKSGLRSNYHSQNRFGTSESHRNFENRNSQNNQYFHEPRNDEKPHNSFQTSYNHNSFESRSSLSPIQSVTPFGGYFYKAPEYLPPKRPDEPPGKPPISVPSPARAMPVPEEPEDDDDGSEIIPVTKTPVTDVKPAMAMLVPPEDDPTPPPIITPIPTTPTPTTPTPTTPTPTTPTPTTPTPTTPTPTTPTPTTPTPTTPTPTTPTPTTPTPTTPTPTTPTPTTPTPTTPTPTTPSPTTPTPTTPTPTTPTTPRFRSNITPSVTPPNLDRFGNDTDPTPKWTPTETTPVTPTTPSQADCHPNRTIYDNPTPETPIEPIPCGCEEINQSADDCPCALSVQIFPKSNPRRACMSHAAAMVNLRIHVGSTDLNLQVSGGADVVISGTTCSQENKPQNTTSKPDTTTLSTTTPPTLDQDTTQKMAFTTAVLPPAPPGEKVESAPECDPYDPETYTFRQGSTSCFSGKTPEPSNENRFRGLLYLPPLNTTVAPKPMISQRCVNTEPVETSKTLKPKDLEGARPWWHVGIYTKTTDPFKQICGGSLVTLEVVISAAHCFWDDDIGLLPAEDYAVAGNKIYRPWNDSHDEKAQKSDVAGIKIPSRFRGGWTSFQDDLAVVRLATPFQYTSGLRPICVDFDEAFNTQQLKEGNRGVVAGWGYMDEIGTPAQQLLWIELPYVEIETCLNITEQPFLKYITSDKICAGEANTSRTLCKGDSGGGLAFWAGEPWDYRPLLRGVGSASASASNLECNIHSVAAFTQIVSHKAFLLEHVPLLEQECQFRL